MDKEDDMFRPDPVAGEKQASDECPLLRDKSQGDDAAPDNPMDKIAYEQ